MSQPYPSSPPARLDWPDAFRGLVVFFIAVFHASMIMVAAGVDMKTTAGFVDKMQSLGMGLFFAISGMNSRRYIDGTLREFVAGRLWPMIYLLVVWGTIFFIVLTLLAHQPIDPGALVRGLALTILLPTSHLWFLWALIVYLVVCRVAVRRYPRASILVALALSFLCTTLDGAFFHRQGLYWMEQQWALRRMLSYPVFFFLGYRYFDQIARLARLPLLPTLVFAFVTATVLPRIGFAINKTIVIAPLLYASLLIGQVGAIQVGRLTARLPGLGKLLRWIGRLTLPVYLMHTLIAMPMIALALLVAPTLVHGHPGWTVAIVALVSVAGALGLAFLFPRLGLLWLLRAPGMDDARYRRRYAAAA